MAEKEPITSLDGLQKRYSTLKGMITKTKNQQEAAKTAKNEAADKLKTAVADESKYKKLMDAAKTFMDNETPGSKKHKSREDEYNRYQGLYNKARKDKEQAEKDEKAADDRITELVKVYKSYEEDINVIIETISKDPLISMFMVRSLKDRFAEKIQVQDAEITKADMLKNKLKNELDSKLSTDFKTALEEARNKPSAASGKKVDDARTALKAEIDKMVDEKGKKLFDGINLTDEDYLAIAEGKDEIPTLQQLKDKAERQKEILNGKLTEKVATLESKRVTAEKTQEVKEKEEALSSMGYTNIANMTDFEIDAAIQALNAEIEEDRKALPEDFKFTEAEKNELDALKNKTVLADNDPRKQALTEAETAHQKALENLINAGYINTNVINALKGEKGEEFAKNFDSVYEEFFKADRELRQEFANIKGQEEPNTDNVKMLIEKYSNKAKTLSELTGMPVEAWNQYLLRDVEKRVNDGKEGFSPVPEEYVPGLAKSKFERFAAENPSLDENVKKEVGDSIDKITEMEGKVFAGQATAAEYETALETYKNTIKTQLVGDLKTKFLSGMKAQLTQKVAGFFGKIKNFFKNLKRDKFSIGAKKAAEGVKIDDLTGNLEDAAKKHKEKELEAVVELSDDDQKRKEELEAKKQAWDEAQNGLNAKEEKSKKLGEYKTARINAVVSQEQELAGATKALNGTVVRETIDKIVEDGPEI